MKFDARRLAFGQRGIEIFTAIFRNFTTNRQFFSRRRYRDARSAPRCVVLRSGGGVDAFAALAAVQTPAIGSAHPRRPRHPGKPRKQFVSRMSARAHVIARTAPSFFALTSCERIDECWEWANKAEALASYAKMADDDSLRIMADRIQARAVRRIADSKRTSR